MKTGGGLAQHQPEEWNRMFRTVLSGSRKLWHSVGFAQVYSPCQRWDPIAQPIPNRLCKPTQGPRSYNNPIPQRKGTPCAPGRNVSVGDAVEKGRCVQTLTQWRWLRCPWRCWLKVFPQGSPGDPSWSVEATAWQCQELSKQTQVNKMLSLLSFTEKREQPPSSRTCISPPSTWISALWISVTWNTSSQRHNVTLLNLHAPSYYKDMFLKRGFYSEQQSIIMINPLIASKCPEQLLLCRQWHSLAKVKTQWHFKLEKTMFIEIEKAVAGTESNKWEGQLNRHK